MFEVLEKDGICFVIDVDKRGIFRRMGSRQAAELLCRNLNERKARFAEVFSENVRVRHEAMGRRSWAYTDA
jgi:hypothetical protein